MQYQNPSDSPGFLLWQITNVWQRCQRNALAEFGLTHVQFVLLAGVAWFSQKGDTLTQVQLSQYAKTDVMMTSQVVRVLENKNLVKRENAPSDHRAKFLTITPLGAEVFEKAVVAVEHVDQMFFAPVVDDMIILTGMLKELAYNNPDL